MLMLTGAADKGLAADKHVADLSILVGATERYYRLYVPRSWERREIRALVIALHGGGTNAASMERLSRLNEMAGAAGFMVAYPQGTGRSPGILTWNAGSCCGHASSNQVDDVGFIARLIDHLVSRFHVDPGRVYATGISNGAMMAYRLAAELPDRIAAIAPVAGSLEVDPSRVRSAVPVVHFHGTADEYVPYEGGHGRRSMPGLVTRPVEETISIWVKANRARGQPRLDHLPNLADDGTTVLRCTYSSDHDPQSVVLYRINGGGHTWPGNPSRERLLGITTRDISANEIMWEFFKAHRKAKK
ncbi:MAG: PHB depolymerase family esterase [Thermodesulfobacteriota bacterium]